MCFKTWEVCEKQWRNPLQLYLMTQMWFQHNAAVIRLFLFRTFHRPTVNFGTDMQSMAWSSLNSLPSDLKSPAVSAPVIKPAIRSKNKSVPWLIRVSKLWLCRADHWPVGSYTLKSNSQDHYSFIQLHLYSRDQWGVTLIYSDIESIITI